MSAALGRASTRWRSWSSCAGRGVSAAAVSIRRAGPDDAAGVAAVLNGVIPGGSPTLLDTPFSVEEERAYIESLPARSFLHVAEAPGAGIVGFQTVIPWNTFVTTEFDHVATMGTYVDAAHRRQGVGAALARSSFAAALALGYDKSSPTCAPTTSTRSPITSRSGSPWSAPPGARARARRRRRRPVHRTVPEGGVTVLYVCATPIGNLGDVTPRVLDALREAELVAAEDTRRTRKLLSHFDIHTPPDELLPAQRAAEDRRGAAAAARRRRPSPWSPTPGCPACRIPACSWCRRSWARDST